MLKTAIFGGSFDPVHRGHAGLAREVLKAGVVNEVMFLPAAKAPHKLDKNMTPCKIRLEMLEAVLEPGMQICRYEIERTDAETSYSYETMRALKKLYPERELFFLMGMDSLDTVHLWRNFLELIRENDFVVYMRPGAPVPTTEQLETNFREKAPNATDLAGLAEKMHKTIVELPNFDVSSTEIREAVQERKPITNLVPEEVAKIIERELLYGA